MTSDLLFTHDTVAGEWTHLPYDSARTPAPDSATFNLAQLALSVLTDAERDTIELLYGFRGSIKSEQEVATLRRRARQTIHTQHRDAMLKMRSVLLVT